MATIIHIPIFDSSPFARRTLQTDSVPNDQSLALDSFEGLPIGCLAVLGIPGNSTAELITITGHSLSGVTVGASGGAPSGGCLYAHVKKREFVQRTLFNKIRVYSGTQPDLSTHSKLEDIDMLVSAMTTPYVDMAGTDTTFYSFSYLDDRNSPVVESQRYVCNAFGIPIDVTPDYVRQNFLFGLDLTDDFKNTLPDSLYWHGIWSAYHWLEQTLGIDILPRTRVDYLDFYGSDYLQYIFLKLQHYPVQEITTDIQGRYYGNTISFPKDWIRLKKEKGILNLVPVSGTFMSFIIGQGGGILPLLNNTSFVPQFWIVNYKTGFAPGELPYNLRDVICKRACFMPLNILGDLVGGVAIASKSIGLDGFSQSINTTNSAENAGYSGRLRQYERELKEDLPMLKNYWSRISATVI